MIVKPCSRNITDSTICHTVKKSAYEFPLRFPFKAFLCSLAKKSWQNSCSFIHPPLIFATQSLIISLQHIKLCISLFRQCLATLGITYVMKTPVLIVSYFAEVVSKIHNSWLSKTLKQWLLHWRFLRLRFDHLRIFISVFLIAFRMFPS